MRSIAAAQTLSPIIDAKRRERIFYTGMAVAILITVFAGFSRTWFLRPYFPQPVQLIPLIVFHGILFSSLIAVFISQTLLLAEQRTRNIIHLSKSNLFRLSFSMEFSSLHGSRSS